jgi:WD40 repeat protein
MNSEIDSLAAIEFINNQLQKKSRSLSLKPSLDSTEEAILKGIWAGDTYPEIAEDVSKVIRKCGANHVRNRGSDLFKLLSTLLEKKEEKIDKGNCQQIITAAIRADGQHRQELPDWQRAQEMQFLEKAHSAGIGSIVVCPDQARFIVGDWDGNIKMWNLAMGQQQKSPVVNDRVPFTSLPDISAIIVLPDREQFISAGYDRTIKIWDLRTGVILSQLREFAGEPIRLPEHHRDGIETLAISTDSQVLASGGFDCTIGLWDLRTLRSLKSLVSDSPILCLAFSYDHQYIYCGCADGTLRMWDLFSRQTAAVRITPAATGWISAIAIGPDGLVYSGDEVGMLACWDAQLLKQRWTNNSAHQSAILTLTVHPQDPNILLSGSYDKTVVIWQLQQRQPVHYIQTPQAGITALALNAQGDRLILGDEQGHLAVWHLPF